MDSVDIVQSAWTLSRVSILSTLSTESMDIVQGDIGHCPLSPCTLSSLNGLPGLCPEYPWTLSRLSTKSMDIVQGVHGHCAGKQWTMSIEFMDIVQSEWAPWTLSRVSMDFVQSIHGLCPDFPLIPWKLSRESTGIVQGAHGFSGQTGSIQYTQTIHKRFN